MSSRLMRGEAIPTEPVAWRRVSSSEAIAREGQPGAGYLAEPAPGPGSRTPEIEQHLTAARQKGFEEGQAASRKTHAGQVETMQMKLARSIEEITGSRARYRREAEQDVVALALAVARRILHRELTVAPEALLGLVKAALDKMEAREVHQVRVSRQDAGMVRQFFEQMGLPHRVEVLGDPNLLPGGVLLESSRGLLDASVDTQLAEIERGFADLVRGKP
jgi:flagellar assembly protein FliH